MATPPFLNLNPEDIPQESSKWMSPIIDAINQFAKQVQYSLNKQLTFDDNIKGFIRTVQINRFPFPIANSLNQKPIGVIIIACEDSSNPVNIKPFAAAGLAYSFSGNSIVINSIGGTVDGNTYNVTLLVIGK